WIEEGLVKIPIGDLIFGSLGLIIGLVIAFLINLPIQEITNIEFVSKVIPLFVTILLGYFGFQVGFRRRDELLNLLSLNRKEKKKSTNDQDSVESSEPRPKILDTSLIIDGRIADICQTSLLEGTIIIPQFVLGEL